MKKDPAVESAIRADEEAGGAVGTPVTGAPAQIRTCYIGAFCLSPLLPLWTHLLFLTFEE